MEEVKTPTDAVLGAISKEMKRDKMEGAKRGRW